MLGGQRALGRRMGVDHTTICHWRGRGIPPQHWPRLLMVAKRRRYKLTLSQIHRHSPLKERKRKPVNGG